MPNAKEKYSELPVSRWIPTRANATRIALWYGGLSALWIGCSGWVLRHLVRDPALEPTLEVIKGWCFVAFTGFLLWLTLDGFFRRIRGSARELQRSEKNYREIFNATGDAIFLHDAATSRVLDVNDAMLRMHGYDSREDYLQGHAERALVQDSEDSWREAQRRIRLAVEEGPQVFEWINHKKNGEPFWVEVSLCSSKIGGEGRVLAVVRDVSQRKAHENEIGRLTRLYATLSQVNQTIVRCRSRAELFNEISRVMIEYGKFRAVWIGEQVSAEGASTTVASHVAESNQESLPGLGSCGVIGEAMQSGCPAFCNQSLSDPRAACCHDMLPKLKVQSCAAFPLRLHGEIFGALSVCSGELDFFRTEERVLLEEIATDISYALDRLAEQEQRCQAEAAMRDSEEKFRQLTDNIADVFWMTSLDMEVIHYVSPAFERIWGRSVANLHADPHIWVEAIVPEDRDRVSNAFISLAEGEGEADLEYRIAHPDGSIRWIHNRGVPVGNAAGELIRLAGVAEDITERRRAETALHEANERLKKILEVETVGVMFWELPSGVMIDANDAFLKLMGYSREQVKARELTWQKLTLPEFMDASLAEIRKFEATGRVGPYEKQYLRKDGGRQWLLFAGTRLDSGTIIEFCVDISAQKNAEAAMRASEIKHRSLYESSLDAILTLDPATQKFTSGNPAALRMFGLKTAAELVALGPADLSPERQPDGRLSSEGVGEIFATMEAGVSDPFEWKHRRLNGEEFFANVLLTHIEWGGHPAILATVRDISVRKEAEAKLRESEERFGALVEAAPEAIFVRTGERFAYVNGAALKLFGASSVDQLLEHSVMDRFRLDYHQEVAGRTEQLDKAGASTLEVERVLLRLDGSEAEVSISAVPINFRGKQSALVFARDVSDRKRAEAALWHQFELRDQLAKIAATVPGTIYSFRLRPDGSMAMPYASAAIEKMFGLRPEQVRDDASPILSLIHRDDASRVRESILTSARTLDPWREEFRGHSPQRGEIWIEGHSVPQLETDGSVLWHGFLYDITERKQADEQLRKLSRAVEQSPASIVITDAKGNIEYVNPKFTELTGYAMDEVRGRNPRFLKTGTTSADEYRQLWQTIRQGETWRGEFLNRKKNGQAFYEFASISPVTDDAGNITHLLAVKEDITERKQLEAQFRQSQKMEAIGTLAGGVAHDFNNILAAMMMQVDLASMAEGVPEEVRDGLREIRAATDRAASLTRQLLLFSRKQVLQPRDLDLNEVVTSLAKMLQRIIREDVRLQLNLHPSPLITHADAGMLDQVLMNLAVNARDAMPAGGQLFIETSERIFDGEAARVHPDAAPGRYVSLSVTDTGTGMTPEVASRVFEPFFTTKEPGKGTGLGLATVFGIIKQHRGWITVQSEPGKGARFQVYLPASEGTAADAPMAARPVSRTGTETILLVEDESSLRRMTRMLLERHGYVVIEAANGVEARQVWKQHRDTIALLLTDLVMPSGMTGQQLARELQSEQPKLKVVFTSGYSAEIAGGEIHLRTGENFLQKPCPPTLLLETIRKTLEN